LRLEQTETKQLHTRSQQGFTLLELLLAMGILLLIVVFSAGALSMGARSVAQGDARMEYLERLRMSLSTIRAQIESQVPLRIEEAGTKRYAFKGDGKTLQLATGYSAWGSEKGPVIVTYRVEDDGHGRQVLRISEVLSGTEAKRETVLLEASEITFEYEKLNPADPAPQWAESWTETDFIPARVRMRLADGKRFIELVIPTYSQGVMMSTGTSVTTVDTPRGLPR
jgi:prepilin-type N-terminal cleavage/methylation domain-containing protein